MKDTVSKRSFVLFSCDGWSVGGTFSCGSPVELAEHLASYGEFFDTPPLLSWRRLARRVFAGRPAFFSTSNAGYLLMPTASVAFYSVRDARLVQTDAASFTLYDLQAARAQDDLEASLGIVKALTANPDGTMTLSKVFPNGDTVSRSIG